jgi:hypothetical protein
MKFTASMTTLRLLLAGDGHVGESAEARRQSVLPQELQRRLGISLEKRFRQADRQNTGSGRRVTDFS